LILKLVVWRGNDVEEDVGQQAGTMMGEIQAISEIGQCMLNSMPFECRDDADAGIGKYNLSVA
jgi:hypothetical protein